MSEDQNDQMEIMRHSLAHIMAAAVKELWPNVKFAIGPAITNGFYYDFDFGDKLISDKDFLKVEKKMKEIIRQDLEFIRSEVAVDEAIAREKNSGQIYKQEMIEDLKKAGETKVSYYKLGEFEDLCRGPHVKTSGQIKDDIFKIVKLAGAYWRGDEKNKMLTRIYAYALPGKEKLEEFLKMLEESEKRDHRKLGKELELFHFSEEIGAGLPLWLPKGTVIREELEKWAKETESNLGYERVVTPHITKSKLFYTSGHLPHYAEDMYSPFKIDEEEYYLKPMNCPFHHMIYKSKPRSYKDLPLRLAEYGTVYRYEQSGTLNGLMRVRGLAQNDAHIYCPLKKAKAEFLLVMKLHQYYYDKLGIKDYYMVLALRDPKNTTKYHGDTKMWDLAEKLTRQAMDESKIPYVEQVGEAAFYGPKIDFIIKTAIGKEYAISTNQLDLYMAGKFKLEYTDANGRKQTPAIIHRAPLGSHERFIAFLIEHYAGVFPVWLSPIQIKLLSVGSAHIKFCKKLAAQFKKQNIRVEIDDNNETIGNKIRKASTEKIPYILVIGDKEISSPTLCVRDRGVKETRLIAKKDFIKEVKEKINNKS